MRAKRLSALFAAAVLTVTTLLLPCTTVPLLAKESTPEVTLRISNSEEYIDTGGWDEEDTIDLPSGDILGIESMVDEFKDWYYETYGVIVNVEYSTFGTNEDLYNMMTLGSEFDLVCPSEYMVMKMMAEDLLEPLSEEFFDTSDPNNYYINGVSPYIQEIFDEEELDGESLSKYMAGYMWGISGIVYNPAVVSEEDTSSWNVLNDEKYWRRITIKDSVRDSYFAAVGAIKHDLLTSEEFVNDPDYSARLEEEMNDTSPETLAAAETWLQEVKDNAYAFETDAGKADMVTGKVVANYQWSGDVVYTLNEAEKDDLELAFTVPEEATNIYFDGWVMMKDGINGDAAKKQAAEAFINYISRPDNVVRNMYYVGYTSCIAGGDDDTIYEYVDWCYGADDDEEDVVEYPVGYFFSGDSDDENYVITAPADQVNRQLSAAYPAEETLERAAIATYFDPETNDRVNQMWIHVRCYNIRDVPVWGWVVLAAVVVVLVVFVVRRRMKKVREK